MGKRIRTQAAKEADQQEIARTVARALMEADPATAVARVISLHTARVGEQLPRIPAVGLEPGAIRGTRPDHARIRG